MSAGALLVAAALLVWPAGGAAHRLRALTAGGAVATTGDGGRRRGPAGVRRILARMPAPLAWPLAAGAAALVTLGPLHAGAAAVLAATAAALRGRARWRRGALAVLDAWERALDDASSALRAGAGPGVALRQAAAAAEAVEFAAIGDPGDRSGRSGSIGGGERGQVSAVLATAAAHAALGGDVAAALLAERPGGSPARVEEDGREDLPPRGDGAAADVGGRTPRSVPVRRPRGPGVGQVAGELAGAWLLATRHGVVLAEVVDGLRADVASRRDRAVRVDSALAGPRATAVILAALPAFGVLLGSGFGADPLTVLLRGPFGGVLCLAGSVFLAAGLLWTDRIAGGALR